MLFLTLSEVLNLDFSKFEAFFKYQIYQNSKLKVPKTVKVAIFEIQILPKLISLRIDKQINSCLVETNFTFSKCLKHSERRLEESLIDSAYIS